jgi:KDO2-lipid IV(A) lauroyltransferase
MAAGPAALALASGTALHPVSIHYERLDRPRWKHRIVITFHDRVEVPATGATRAKAVAMTQQCADALGAAIVEHTADWHMLQRVFLDDLTPRADEPARPARATGTWP